MAAVHVDCFDVSRQAAVGVVDVVADVGGAVDDVLGVFACLGEMLLAALVPVYPGEPRLIVDDGFTKPHKINLST